MYSSSFPPEPVTLPLSASTPNPSWRESDLVGRRAGDVEIVAVLGIGGTSVVYQVRNLLSGRFEAMKLLRPGPDRDPEAVRRFAQEIRLHAAARIPGVAAFHAAECFARRLAMRLEFVEGETVQQRLQDGPLAVEEAVGYAIQTLRTLSRLHRRGIVHCDVKPANLVARPDGVIKLLDFGAAQELGGAPAPAGELSGTLRYMSPEQIRGNPRIDERVDIYALGATLYEMLTGRPPFQDRNAYALMAAHLYAPPVAPNRTVAGIPDALNEAVLRALAKEPHRRQQTAEAFRQDLEQLDTGELTSAPALRRWAASAG